MKTPYKKLQTKSSQPKAPNQKLPNTYQKLPTKHFQPEAPQNIPKAPKLKSLERPRFFFGFQSYLGDESEEESEKEEDQPDPSLYAHYFNVTLGDEQIYIEDPLEPNEAGQL